MTVRERNELLFSKPPQIVRVKPKSKKRTGVPIRETYKLIPQPIPLRDMHEASPPSITSREMRVNAGVEDGNRKKVREKVKAHKGFRWPVKVQKEIKESGLVFSEHL